MEIIETISKSKSEDIQAQIHAARIEMAESLGYTIVVSSGVPGIPDGTKGIVPKNPDGQDNPNGQITWQWDTPRQTPDDTYEIQALPSVLPPDQIDGELEQDFVQRERPIEWSQGYSENQFNSQFDPVTMEV